jgi:glutaredoxin-related protein
MPEPYAVKVARKVLGGVSYPVLQQTTKYSTLKPRKMTNRIFGVLFAVTLILTSCTNTLDKKLNKEDFDKVKQEINSNEQYSKMKKKYIIDNLSMQLEYAELGKAMNMDEADMPTFREQIDELTTDFDSVRIAKLEIRENNRNLENFVTLKDANTVSIDKYKGYLSMTLDFNNQFDKEILYIILNYKYVNKYDTEFFDEKSKLTDEVAEDFNGEVEISTKEEYNNVANFMYTKVPVRAKQELRDELGEEEANKKVKKEFLMEGLKVSTLEIIFKDKSVLVYQVADWEYLEEEK